MKLQLSFFFTPRPRLSLAEVEAILRQRKTFGLKGRSRNWFLSRIEEGVFDAVQDSSGQWYIYADSFLNWLAKEEGHPIEKIDQSMLDKILGIQAIAA
ncbi:MAG TPA: hypothetical protein VEF04_22725 [Blastocatellia bacterium]|nr:hypothetical protein [Blastocatellia bacterium]